MQRRGSTHSVRPVAFVIGILVAVLGLSMLLPALIDLLDSDGNARSMALSAFLTVGAGIGIALATSRRDGGGLSRPQAFMLTVGVWAVLPLFGAIPFMLGAPAASFTDAYFEAMSGLTTTGSTVFTELEFQPRGMLLWRAMLQWFGGVGIVVFAMVFLPMLKVGGMQLFRSEAFDLQSDILPRAIDAAVGLAWFYIGLTVACILAYSAAGMGAFEATAHAMTTVSTGGLGTRDSSFTEFSASAQYAAIAFMILGGLPFLLLIRGIEGRPSRLLRDPQSQAFLGIIAFVTTALMLWLLVQNEREVESAFRAALFNTVSILTGTGYSSENYSAWGGFPIAFFFLIAMIGGCAGSTSCSAKVFRYQILGKAIWVQLRRIHAPNGVFPLRYDGRVVDAEVLSSVMGFFFVFVASIAGLAVALSMVGMDPLSAISGSVAALCNVGPGLGEAIGPNGNYAEIGPAAKWLLSGGMLLGRLEFLSVLVLFTRVFWMR